MKNVPRRRNQVKIPNYETRDSDDFAILFRKPDRAQPTARGYVHLALA
jgi:hypothetical protein